MVTHKIKDTIQKLNLILEETAALEDLITENNQFLKQAEIYSTTLSGLMDARGSLINNKG